MSYDVEITKHVGCGYSEEGEWLNGDFRTIEEPVIEVESFDPADDPYDTPYLWAVHLIESTDVTEASAYPIGLTAAPHVWLTGYYTDPYTGHCTETTVRLTGDWTDKQRADVFHAVA